MHLDEEQIWRALHGELGPQVEVSVREHLVECAFCSEQVAEARREEAGVYTLLSQVDHPPPPVAAEALVARARTARRGWQRLHEIRKEGFLHLETRSAACRRALHYL